MDPLLIVLYIVGAVSEALGLFLTIREIVRGRRRLGEYLRRPQTIYSADAATAVEAQRVRLIQDPPPSLDERVAVLESQLDAVRDDLDARERRSTETVQKRTSTSIEATAKRVQDVQQQLEEYVLDDRRLLQSGIFVGPALLGLGLILGALGNVLSLWA